MSTPDECASREICSTCTSEADGPHCTNEALCTTTKRCDAKPGKRQQPPISLMMIEKVASIPPATLPLKGLTVFGHHMEKYYPHRVQKAFVVDTST